MSRSAAFTLIELLIVIAIITILAVIAIPQFRESTNEANASALSADLTVMRDAIELYYHQHEQTYPGVSDGEEEGGGGEAEHVFIHQLILCSNRDGDTTTSLDRTNYPYGPYLKRIPENPLASGGIDQDGVKVTESLTSLEPESNPQKAWLYSSRTGELISNIEE